MHWYPEQSISVGDSGVLPGLVPLVDADADRERQRHLVAVAINRSNDATTSNYLATYLLRSYAHRVFACWSRRPGACAELRCTAAADAGYYSAAKQQANQRQTMTSHQPFFAEGEAEQTETEHCCKFCFALAAVHFGNPGRDVGLDRHDYGSRAEAAAD